MTNQQLTAQAVDRYADMVWRLALARTGSKTDAEDVFQEVFLQHLRRGQAFTSPEHEKAWLSRLHHPPLRLSAHCRSPPA